MWPTLEELATELQILEARVAVAIARERAHDKTWTAIGHRLNMTPQRVSQRYGRRTKALMSTTIWSCPEAGCDWHLAYPAWDASAAWDDIGEHQIEHMD